MKLRRLNLGLHFYCVRCGKRTPNGQQHTIQAVWYDAHIPTRLDFLCPVCHGELCCEMTHALVALQK